MVNLRKSTRSRRTKRSSRRSSRRSKRQGQRQRQRGGGIIVLNCTLGPDNKVQVTPPEGFTTDNSVVNTLTMTPNAAVTNITFAGPNGAVLTRYLGVGTGIIIQQGTETLVPTGFTAVRRIVSPQRQLTVTAPAAANTAIKITNLNTANLGLSASNRSFTITITTV